MVISWGIFNIYLRRMCILVLCLFVCLFLCRVENSVYVLYRLVRAIGSVVEFESFVSLLMFCLVGLSNIENVVEVYYYCISIYFSPQICQCVLYILRGSGVECIYIYSCYIFFMNWLFNYYIITFFVSCTGFDLSVLSFGYHLHGLSFAWNIHIQSIYAFNSKVNLLYTTYSWILFLFYPFNHSMSFD